MGGVDECFEEGGTNFFVEAGDDRVDFLKGGEGLKFAGTEEFDVPMVDAGVSEVGFLVGAVVELDVLCDSCLEFGVVGGWGAFHPGFNRGGVDFGDVVAESGVEVDEELFDGVVFVGGVHGVDSSDHHDELGFEPHFTQVGDEGVGFFG